jgi:hypothetical protein
MMRVLTIDPSSIPKNRGYALTVDGLLAWYGSELDSLALWAAGDIDVAACEAQYASPDSSRESLITLGNYAGFLLGQVPARLHLLVPVSAWKGRVIPGFANAEKKIYTANLREMYPDVLPPRGALWRTVTKGKRKGQRELTEDPASNRLDAIGLGRSFFPPCRPYTAAELTEWEMQ